MHFKFEGIKANICLLTVINIKQLFWNLNSTILHVNFIADLFQVLSSTDHYRKVANAIYNYKFRNIHIYRNRF